jgi:hypothetical protein
VLLKSEFSAHSELVTLTSQLLKVESESIFTSQTFRWQKDEQEGKKQEEEVTFLSLIAEESRCISAVKPILFK